MGWICRVCGEQAKYVYEFGTSLMNKKGFYRVHKSGYCKEHKPICIIDKHQNNPPHKEEQD